MSTFSASLGEHDARSQEMWFNNYEVCFYRTFKGSPHGPTEELFRVLYRSAKSHLELCILVKKIFKPPKIQHVFQMN